MRTRYFPLFSRLPFVLPLLLLMSLVAMTACRSEAEEPGVVARVNGRPILLSQVEFNYDLLHNIDSAGSNPALAQLREEYGEILAELVVQELILQELEARGMGVTKIELTTAEDQVRADYPPGAFEETLIEECIDLNGWRRQLKARLALQKFNDLVLRPSVKIDYQEAEAYYRSHLSDFYLPERLSFLFVSGPSKDVVQKAMDLYLKGSTAEEISAKFRNVEARNLRMRVDRLPPSWSEILLGLDKGGRSGIIAGNAGFECFLVLEKIPGKVLDPSQAYPLVEKLLVEQKVSQAFKQWLDKALATADIKVSVHLLEKTADEEAVAADAEGTTEENASPVEDSLSGSEEDLRDVPPAEDEIPEAPAAAPGQDGATPSSAG